MMFIMLGKYAGFVGEVWKDFPQLAEWHDDDPSLLSMWSMDKFIELAIIIFMQKESNYSISVN